MKHGLVILKGGTARISESTESLTSTMVFDDSNLRISGGYDEMSNGGSIIMESGSSGSQNTGSITISSKDAAIESSGGSGSIHLKGGNSVSNTGNVIIESGTSIAGKAGLIDLKPGVSVVK